MSDSFPYPHQYAEFLAEYHGSRDFFECHEIMEEYWKQQAGSRYEACWLVLVRISVACYHARRGNWAGARKLMAKAAAQVDAERISELGLDGPQLARLLAETSEQWRMCDPPVYRDIDLPITDARLLEESMRICRERGWQWRMPSAHVAVSVVQKHLLRDRTQVVENRRRAAERKRLLRGE